MITARTSVQYAADFINRHTLKESGRVLILMVGLPGSGKSTVVAELLELVVNQRPLPTEVYPEIAVVSTDNLIEAYGEAHGLNYSQAFVAVDSGEITREFNRNVLDAATRRDHIVIDQTSVGVQSRNRKIRQLQQLYRNYVPIVLYVTATPEILNTRRHQRGLATGKHIPQGVCDNMAANLVVKSPDDICQTWLEVFNN
jgi:predicted kinase